MRKNKNHRLVVLGQSTFFGNPKKNTLIAELKGMYPNLIVVDRTGVDQTLEHMLERFDCDVVQLRADIVVLAIGNNDMKIAMKKGKVGSYEETCRYGALLEDYMLKLWRHGIKCGIIFEPFYVPSWPPFPLVQADIKQKVLVTNSIALRYKFNVIQTADIINNEKIIKEHEPVVTEDGLEITDGLVKALLEKLKLEIEEKI